MMSFLPQLPFGRRHAAIAVVALMASGVSGAGAQGRAFDAYFAGVHVAELRVTATSYSIRKKGFASNRWGALHTAPVASVATDTAFLLWGSLRDVAGRIAGIERLGWSGHEVVAWPDRGSLYERWRDVRPAGARTPIAARWHRRDASFPMDLVLDARNRLVAAIDPSRDVVLVQRGDEGYTTVAEWQTPGLSPARHGYRALGKQMIPMPDGVRLATLVYLPSEDAPGPYPTILVRSPYGISGSISGFWHYAARGYAVVFQATRGTSYNDPDNRSEGDLELMVHEPADGKATLDWIAQQPWSTGGVCMQGGSYLGYTQWTAAMSGHPALKCLIPEVSMGTAFADQPYVGGGLLVGMAYYAFWMNNQPLLPGRTWTEVLSHRPLLDLDTYGTGVNIPTWDAQLLNATNNAYWQRQDWHRGNVRPELATFQVSGWFDDDLPGTLSNWALMQRIGTAPQRLILGPWKHGYNVAGGSTVTATGSAPCARTSGCSSSNGTTPTSRDVATPLAGVGSNTSR